MLTKLAENARRLRTQGVLSLLREKEFASKRCARLRYSTAFSDARFVSMRVEDQNKPLHENQASHI